MTGREGNGRANGRSIRDLRENAVQTAERRCRCKTIQADMPDAMHFFTYSEMHGVHFFMGKQASTCAQQCGKGGSTLEEMYTEQLAEE